MSAADQERARLWALKTEASIVGGREVLEILAPHPRLDGVRRELGLVLTQMSADLASGNVPPDWTPSVPPEPLTLTVPVTESSKEPIELKVKRTASGDYIVGPDSKSAKPRG